MRVYRRGVLAHTLPALRTGAVLALQWSPDATRLLGGTADAAAVWNTDTGEVVESVDTHTGTTTHTLHTTHSALSRPRSSHGVIDTSSHRQAMSP